MDPWDGRGASETGTPARSAGSADSGGRPPVLPDESELTAALQLALDRRDNGGEGAKRPQ
jgi:hypothetical protein